MKLKVKFKIARIILMLLTLVLSTITRKGRYKWMYHYLKGRGGTQTVPFKWVDQSSGMFDRISDGQDGQYCVDSTVLYEGAGFGSRPELFYMIGGFTFHIERLDTEHVRIEFTDVYDWHPAPSDYDEEENWFTTPLPHLFATVGRFIFGDFYFPEWGFPMGQEGVSNAFWCDLAHDGAKEFTSVFSGVISIPERR
jgi:hypothetical protein